MKNNEKGIDINKTKPNFNLNAEEKNAKIMDNISDKDIKSGNNLNKNEKIGEKKDAPLYKEPVSTKFEKITDEQIRKGAKLALKKYQLDISEMIEKPQDKLNSKNSNSNLARSYLLNKLIEFQSDERNLLTISLGLEEIHKEIKDGLIKNTIKFSEEKKTFEEIIIMKERKKNFDLEETLRQQKIKEIQDNKEFIGNKIKNLDENLKIIENDAIINNISRIEINNSILGKDQVEDNIRRSKIKEIKQAKNVLEKKLYTLNNQVDELINEEDVQKDAKKFNLKHYLENFEKDKAIAEVRAQKWDHERKERVITLKEMEEKTNLKLKKREEEVKENNNRQQEKRKKEYMENLKELRNNRSRIHDEVMNLKDEWTSKIRKDYIHYKLEDEFKKKLEDQRNSELKILQDKKYSMKPVLREEIDEFSKKVQDDRERKMMEREKQRLNKLEEILSKNENLPKPQTSAYQKIMEEEKKLKEIKEKEKLEKIYKNLSIKKFSKNVRNTFVPTIDENKRKEINERIIDLGSKSKKKNKHKTDKTKRILLKKPDPNNPRKYNWELKLNISEDYTSKRGRDDKNRKRDKNVRSLSSKLRGNNSIDHKDINVTSDEDILNHLNKRVSKSRSVEKRKPMEKHPDYLTEMRVQKEYLEMNASNVSDKMKEKSEKKWKKMINNEKYSLLENVEQIKIKANMLEQQAKMKEKFLQYNGGTEKNPEMGEDVSNMLIDAIKAKLTILDCISKKK